MKRKMNDMRQITRLSAGLLALALTLTLSTVSIRAEHGGFTVEAFFIATQHPNLGTPFGGLGFDPVAEKVEILAVYIPNSFLTIFEFDGSQASFGTFVRDFSNSIVSGPPNDFPAITVDSVHGVAYFLQDQASRIVINPRHLNPRNPPPNNFIDFIVNETGPAGITYDERDDTLIILLRSVFTNSGQQIIRIPMDSGTILSRIPVDPTLAIDRDSEIVLDPTSGNYLVSVGSQIFEITPDGIKTGQHFSSPNGQKVMGMEFGTSNQFVILEANGAVSLGIISGTLVDITVTPSVPVPIIVPAGGIILDMVVTVDNNSGSTLNAQIWNTVTLLDFGGEEIGPVGGIPVMPFSVPDGGQFTTTISNFEFPGGVRPGNYIFNWKVGTFPNVVLDRDTFGFSKAAGPTLTKADDDDWGLGPAKEATVPEKFSLEQNYPNPFNPTTEIRFQLPEASQVVVRIFNTLGQEIRILVDSPYAAGDHTVRWDSKDNNGNAVSSAIYLYQLQAGGFSQNRKMTLLR